MSCWGFLWASRRFRSRRRQGRKVEDARAPYGRDLRFFVDFGACKRIGDLLQGIMCPCLEIRSDGLDKAPDVRLRLMIAGRLEEVRSHAIG